MPLKSYLIAPFESGLESDLEPWLLPEDAFDTLENAYVWRGRVRKRWGYSLIATGDNADLNSQLRHNIGTTDGTGAFSATVPGTIFAVGQRFSVDTEIFTVFQTGTPAATLSTGAGSATYDTTTGAVVITGAAINTDVFFYPSTPVMGLRLREGININFEEVVAFDREFSYIRLAGAWSELTGQWSSSDAQFIWTTNYRSTTPDQTALWACNNVRYSAGPPETDGIKYLDFGSTTWVTIRPQLDSDATRFLDGCLILVGFKDRLIALNTLESGVSNAYQNRARWSINGDPTNETTGWIDDVPGKGGYIDAATEEAIITCQFIKDKLIVYFERSTWELVYTGNAILPFRWQILNNELGCESTFSIIGFDNGAVGVGNVGVHSCDSVSVGRIDNKIPDEVFNIHDDSDGPERVYGIRDYFGELVYWAFPTANTNPKFPDRVLVWNYKNKSWAIFKDSFTCFGYFQDDASLTWGTVGSIYKTWGSWTTPWGSGQNQAKFNNIIAGNQQGMVVTIFLENERNAENMIVTNMDTAAQELTIISHNLSTGDFLKIANAGGITLNQNGDGDDITIFKVIVVDDDTISIDNGGTTSGVDEFAWTGTYTGGGLVGRVSRVNLISKQWNPGTPVGQQFRMPYIDFLLDTTPAGEVIVDCQIDFSGWPIQDQDVSGALLGSNVLFTRPEDNNTYQTFQTRIWHRYYIMTQGQTIQINLTLSDSQMRDPTIAESAVTINAMLLYVEPQGRIIG